MKKPSSAVLTAFIVLSLGGCASSLTGLGGSDHLACKAPDGVTCASLSGVYANAVENNLPGLQKTHPAAKTPLAAAKKTSHETGITGETPTSGDPVFSKPHVMRLWIAPWADAEGDLHDQSYLYVVTNGGQWEIEHNERQIMNRYQPTFLKQPAKVNAPEQSDASNKGPKVITNGSMMLPNAQGFVPPSGQMSVQ